MIEHIPIPIFSTPWWIGILSVIAVVFLILKLYKRIPINKKVVFAKLLGWVLIVIFVVSNVISFENGSWNLQDNLPFQICYISYLIGIVLLFTKKQWMFEWMYFIGIIGGVYALLTPILTIGNSSWFYFEFYFLHSSIILIPLVLLTVKGMKIRVDSWWKTMLRLQIPILILLPLNYILDANYMFLAEKPIVDNPFLIGEWPFYLIIIDIITLLHVVVIYKLTPEKI